MILFKPVLKLLRLKVYNFLSIWGDGQILGILLQHFIDIGGVWNTYFLDSLSLETKVFWYHLSWVIVVMLSIDVNFFYDTLVYSS